MKDEKHIRRFAERFDLNVTVFTEHQFICDKAVKDGAVKSISITNKQRYDIMDFAIDKDGNCIGTYTDSIDSYNKRSL